MEYYLFSNKLAFDSNFGMSLNSFYSLHQEPSVSVQGLSPHPREFALSCTTGSRKESIASPVQVVNAAGWLFSMTIFNSFPCTFPYRGWNMKDQLCQSPFRLGVAMRQFQPKDMTRRQPEAFWDFTFLIRRTKTSSIGMRSLHLFLP